METLVVDGWTVRHDRAAAACHRTLARGDADRCGCSSCRNFAPQRPTAFPPGFLPLLEQLGVDRAKEHEAYMAGPAGDGLHLYSGWFCFVGGVAVARPEYGATFNDIRFGFGFTSSFPRVGEPPRESVPTVAFRVPLPWLLPDEAPDERAGDA